MANKTLFASTRGALLPVANTINREGSAAYEYAPKQKLAQYAATGCLSNTFYTGAHEQLATILELTREVEPAFMAKPPAHGLLGACQAGLRSRLCTWRRPLGVSNPAAPTAIVKVRATRSFLKRRSLQVERSIEM